MGGVQLGPGTVIGGRYAVERRLGAGGVGQVWAGRSTVDGTEVAIKTLLPAAAVHRELVARFKREAQFLSRIKSQYVARVVDFLSDDEHGLVLVLELVHGEALSEALRKGRLSVEQALDVAWDVLGGVADLHRQQIVHRDLKPGNVILTPSPSGRMHAVIVDFGMSRISGLDENGEEITALTRADIAVGTIEYMAPEQILNSRGVTSAADIYAVGAMLYRVVAGRHVFDGFDDRAVLARHKMINDPEPLMTGRDDALAKGFETLVMRMIRRLPAERYQRADDALADIATLRAGGSLASSAPHHDAPPVPSAPRHDAPLASDPPFPVSSAPAHPITLPVAPAPSPPPVEESSAGRFLGVVALALIVAAGAVVLGLRWQKRAAVEEEASGISVVESPAAPEPSRSPAPPEPTGPPIVAVAPSIVPVTPPVASVEPALPKLAKKEPPASEKRASAEAQREKPAPSAKPAEAAPAELPFEVPADPFAEKAEAPKPPAPKKPGAKPKAEPAEPKEPAPTPVDTGE